jgi:Ca-activated chloride channel family protein
VNTLDEADRLFNEDLLGTLQSVALDARAQVEFERDAVAEYRLVGYENRAIDDDDFRDPDVEAGAIGAGHAVTALYAVRLHDGVGQEAVLATVRLRWNDPTSRSEERQAREARLSDLAGSFSATRPHFKLAAVVAATAEVLRGSRWSGGIELDEVADLAAEIEHELPEDEQVGEFLELLDNLASLDR